MRRREPISRCRIKEHSKRNKVVRRHSVAHGPGPRKVVLAHLQHPRHPRMLQCRFREVVDWPIADDIRRVRIEQAKYERSHSQYSLAEIARFGNRMRMYDVIRRANIAGSEAWIRSRGHRCTNDCPRTTPPFRLQAQPAFERAWRLVLRLFRMFRRNRVCQIQGPLLERSLVRIPKISRAAYFRDTDYSQSSFTNVGVGPVQAGFRVAVVPRSAKW